MNFSSRTITQKAGFDQFEATALYCPKCKKAVPVRKHLLLILPEGDKYDYVCVYCDTSLGNKIDKTSGQNAILV
ncbi:MAG: cytoplasmic protein [Deltaproteobacteria bacterium]|nr:cytoplasmic protein [Deltaproteobacteria bacterium]MBW1926028.1 cytoplasmic protein [Deltaproteobacteria bacterium]MBW1947435.1 cytoplasmic protein [Deltaproteobacteria bacterium]MBW1966028.1 cytoplasmic protein [Deltaproteobacteria bacterium]MBW2097460.1 cytoplasmic protein [Deltaproteobacteria bacterium]